MSNTIQSGGFLGKTLSNVRSKKALLHLVGSLAKHFLPKLATQATSSVLHKFNRKISGWGVVWAGKEFTFFISNKDMDDLSKSYSHQENQVY